MTPVTTSKEVSASQEIIKKELDELLAMAEASTTSIEALFDTRQKTLLRTVGYVLIQAILLVLVAMGITGSKELGLGESTRFVAVFLCPLIGFFTYAAFLGSSLFHVGRAERSSLPTMR